MTEAAEQQALASSLDNLPMEDLDTYSEKYFDKDSDAKRVPSFGGRFLIVKINNETQLFEFLGKAHDNLTGVIKWK